MYTIMLIVWLRALQLQLKICATHVCTHGTTVVANNCGATVGRFL